MFSYKLDDRAATFETLWITIILFLFTILTIGTRIAIRFQPCPVTKLFYFSAIGSVMIVYWMVRLDPERTNPFMRPGWDALQAFANYITPRLQPLFASIHAWMNLEYIMKLMMNGYLMPDPALGFEHIKRFQLGVALLACVGCVTVLLVVLRCLDILVLMIQFIMNQGTKLFGQETTEVKRTATKGVKGYRRRKANF